MASELEKELEFHRSARLRRLRRRIESEIKDFVYDELGSEIAMVTQDYAGGASGASTSLAIRVNFTDARGQEQKLVVVVSEIPTDDDRFRVAPMQV